MTTQTSISKNRDTINIRIQPEQRELIDRAASILGKNRTEFILEVACQEAESVIADNTFFALDEEKYEQFVEILNSPPKAIETVTKLLMAKSPWENNDGRNRNTK